VTVLTTADQRAAVARLRRLHPRARVLVAHTQPERPLLRVFMRWGTREKRSTIRAMSLWLTPAGERIRIEQIVSHDRRAK
jgi:hypothetical protein